MRWPAVQTYTTSVDWIYMCVCARLYYTRDYYIAYYIVIVSCVYRAFNRRSRRVIRLVKFVNRHGNNNNNNNICNITPSITYTHVCIYMIHVYTSARARNEKFQFHFIIETVRVRFSVRIRVLLFQ